MKSGQPGAVSRPYPQHRLVWKIAASGYAVPVVIPVEERGPFAGKLEIIVKKAKGLYKTNLVGKLNPYLEVKIGKYKFKTGTDRSGNRDPEWNEPMTFFLEGNEETIRLKMWDKNHLLRNDLVGMVRIPLASIILLHGRYHSANIPFLGNPSTSSTSPSFASLDSAGSCVSPDHSNLVPSASFSASSSTSSSTSSSVPIPPTRQSFPKSTSFDCSSSPHATSSVSQSMIQLPSHEKNPSQLSSSAQVHFLRSSTFAGFSGSGSEMNSDVVPPIIVGNNVRIHRQEGEEDSDDEDGPGMDSSGGDHKHGRNSKSPERLPRMESDPSSKRSHPIHKSGSNSEIEKDSIVNLNRTSSSSFPTVTSNGSNSSGGGDDDSDDDTKSEISSISSVPGAVSEGGSSLSHFKVHELNDHRVYDDVVYRSDDFPSPTPPPPSTSLPSSQSSLPPSNPPLTSSSSGFSIKKKRNSLPDIHVDKDRSTSTSNLTSMSRPPSSSYDSHRSRSPERPTPPSNPRETPPRRSASPPPRRSASPQPMIHRPISPQLVRKGPTIHAQTLGRKTVTVTSHHASPARPHQPSYYPSATVNVASLSRQSPAPSPMKPGPLPTTASQKSGSKSDDVTNNSPNSTSSSGSSPTVEGSVSPSAHKAVDMKDFIEYIEPGAGVSIQDPRAAWFDLGRGDKQVTPAGAILLSFRFTPGAPGSFGPEEKVLHVPKKRNKTKKDTRMAKLFGPNSNPTATPNTTSTPSPPNVPSETKADTPSHRRSKTQATFTKASAGISKHTPEEPKSSGNSGRRKSLEQAATGRLPLFGGPLINGVRRSKSSVPVICYVCINFLTYHGLEVEGIFRISGNKERMDEIAAAFERGDSLNLLDPHDTAGTLKRYLRELEEPLIPLSLYEPFTTCADVKEPPQDKYLKYRELVRTLPVENYTLLSYLINFFRLVDSKSHINKMAAKNCATVLAPNILRKNDNDTRNLLQDMERANLCVLYLIQGYPTIFPEGPPTPFALSHANLDRVTVHPLRKPEIIHRRTSLSFAKPGATVHPHVVHSQSSTTAPPPPPLSTQPNPNNPTPPPLISSYKP